VPSNTDVVVDVKIQGNNNNGTCIIDGDVFVQVFKQAFGIQQLEQGQPI